MAPYTIKTFFEQWRRKVVGSRDTAEQLELQSGEGCASHRGLGFKIQWILVRVPGI